MGNRPGGGGIANRPGRWRWRHQPGPCGGGNRQSGPALAVAGSAIGRALAVATSPTGPVAASAGSATGRAAAVVAHPIVLAM